MDRRAFLNTTGAGAVVAGASATLPASAAADTVHQPRTLKVAIVADAPDRSPIADAVWRLGETLREVSGAALTLDLTASADDPTTATEADAIVAMHDHFADVAPALKVLTGVAGTMSDWEASRLQVWLRAGGGQMHWNSVLAAVGFAPFAIATNLVAADATGAPREPTEAALFPRRLTTLHLRLPAAERMTPVGLAQLKLAASETLADDVAGHDVALWHLTKSHRAIQPEQRRQVAEAASSAAAALIASDAVAETFVRSHAALQFYSPERNTV